MALVHIARAPATDLTQTSALLCRDLRSPLVCMYRTIWHAPLAQPASLGSKVILGSNYLRRERFTICRCPVVDSAVPPLCSALIFNNEASNLGVTGSYMGRMANAERVSGDCTLLSVKGSMLTRTKTRTMQRQKFITASSQGTPTLLPARPRPDAGPLRSRNARHSAQSRRHVAALAAAPVAACQHPGCRGSSRRSRSRRRARLGVGWHLRNARGLLPVDGPVHGGALHAS